MIGQFITDSDTFPYAWDIHMNYLPHQYHMIFFSSGLPHPKEKIYLTLDMTGDQCLSLFFENGLLKCLWKDYYSNVTFWELKSCLHYWIIANEPRREAGEAAAL